MFARIVFSLTAVLIATTVAMAAPYSFNGVLVEVDAWAGTGSNESILVVDWNRLDNGPSTITESHAFGYRWNGTQYVSDMLAAFDTAGIFDVTTGYGGAFLVNIVYNDGTEGHQHIEAGSWNLASTTDPYANWGSFGNSDWDFNQGGMTQEVLADGQFEGINAILYFGSLPSYADDELNIPIVPEPATAYLLLASMTLFGCRRALQA